MGAHDPRALAGRAQELLTERYLFGQCSLYRFGDVAAGFADQRGDPAKERVCRLGGGVAMSY